MKIVNKIVSFFKEVKQELAKVAWSTRQELIDSTLVVITITFIMGLFIGLIDLLLSKILSIVFR